MTQARSIDAAANGYVRHRFVRALCASFVVGAVFGIVAIVAGASISTVLQGDWATVALLPLGFLLVFLLFAVPVALFVTLGGAIVDILHRRLVALATFIVSFAGVFVLGASVLYSALSLTGFDVTLPAGDAIWFGMFGAIATLISYQLMRASWWQLTASAENFRAVRGWRPAPWRLFTSFRRYLGLPSFLSYVGKKRRMVTLLYFGVAVLNLGLLMILMLPIFIGSEGDPQYPQSNPYILYTTLGGLLLLNLIGAGGVLARMADQRTTKLYQNVREWDARAPIIFLRAFDQDDERLKARGGDPFARWPAGVGSSRTLDEILLEHGSPYGPVIAIGDPRDPTPPLGAARVFVEGVGDEWQSVVRGLAGASKAVVMCPNHGEGVQWELDLIAQAGGRLQTIFLASPELDRAATLTLFARLVPDMPAIPEEQLAIAAYSHRGEWRVLTTKRLSLESYSAALNTALQVQFGLAGEPLKRPARA
ncbi:hypothetical protein [Terricaulis silvestris]|uniref:DUF2868 domain-containing protein n=1 Tax=Terricaulis silvestris TaxID=2686094 RepID=A0A6I6MGQ4_9CAUL|nr:hypothetical protein [Terricaulis silvestris]QGZ93905.1 hypothetical protein DSM104635_00719 [Terricaulis silvestris]